MYISVSKNNGTPKSSILIGFSIINHPFWGTPIFGNTHIFPIIENRDIPASYVSVSLPGFKKTDSPTRNEMPLLAYKVGPGSSYKWS